MGITRLRLLLDTHSFLWWLADHKALSRPAHRAIDEEANEVFVSAASAWEITTKFRVGKLSHAEAVAKDVQSAIAGEAFQPLPVTVRHGQLAGSFAGALRDPFDRMLIAQAMIEDMTLVSNERAFDAYAVRRLW